MNKQPISNNGWECLAKYKFLAEATLHKNGNITIKIELYPICGKDIFTKITSD